MKSQNADTSPISSQIPMIVQNMINSPDIAPYSDHTASSSKYVAAGRSSAAAWVTHKDVDIACTGRWLGAVLGTLAVRHNPKAIRDRIGISRCSP
jgi:hypothetical protein